MACIIESAPLSSLWVQFEVQILSPICQCGSQTIPLDGLPMALDGIEVQSLNSCKRNRIGLLDQASHFEQRRNGEPGRSPSIAERPSARRAWLHLQLLLFSHFHWLPFVDWLSSTMPDFSHNYHSFYIVKPFSSIAKLARSPTRPERIPSADQNG